MLRSLAKLVLAGALISASTTAALAQQPTASQTAPPSSALTTQITTFFTGILAGHLPATGLTDKMKSAFTPDLISEIDAMFAPLGTFQKLQFVSQDSIQGYQRYHYVAVFDKGTQPLLFVLDSSGNIAGFFKDQNQ